MANQSRYKLLHTFLSGANSNSWGANFDVTAYRHLFIVVSTASSAAGTIKIAGSFLPSTDVDFTSAAAVGNEWDFAGSWNLNSQSAVIAGDTGIVYSGTDSVEQVEVSTDGFATLNVQLSNRSAGTFTVQLFGVTNQ